MRKCDGATWVSSTVFWENTYEQRVVTFSRQNCHNEGDMRLTTGYNSKEQIEKNKKHTYDIHYIFLKGGKIIQVSPAEVVPPGGHWGNCGQDQQGCGHKVKLHSSIWPKINTTEAMGWWIAVGGSESLRNSRGESLVGLWQRWRSGCSSQWLLYLVLSRKK